MIATVLGSARRELAELEIVGPFAWEV